MKQRICVSVGKDSLRESLGSVSAMKEQADVIEIRLDLMSDLAISPFIDTIDIPLLFTNRAKWEGGGFTGEEKARVAFLEEAVMLGAAYVDLELLASQDSWALLRKAADDSGTKLISSWHNFEETPAPDELLERLKMMQGSGADIGKIVTMAHDFHDVLRLLNLQESASQMGLPLIAFCMGKAGVMSRVATVALGGYMTYSSLGDGETVAPGQVPLATLKEIYHLLGMVEK